MASSKKPSTSAAVPLSIEVPDPFRAASLFAEADVRYIAVRTGLPIKSKMSADLIAEDWSDLFFASSPWLGHTYGPKGSELRAFYTRVDKAAVALLEALGLPRNSAEVVLAMQQDGRATSRALQHLCWDFQSDSRDWLRLAAPIAERLVDRGQDMNDPISVQEALDRAPFGVALIALLARRARVLNGATDAVGAPYDYFQREMYERLAVAFKVAFGVAPEVGSERFQDCASTRWVRCVLATAAARAKRCISPSDHPLVAAIRKEASRRPSTKADALAEAQHRLLQYENNCGGVFGVKTPRRRGKSTPGDA